MDNIESKITHYLIPANVKTNFEFFSGFGWKELIITIIVALISFAFYKIMGLLNISGMVKIILFVIPIVITIALTTETNGISIKKYINNIRNYSKKQKRYLYKHKSGNFK